tara:strand:- start:135 stop:1391 length:1257 start_codon:yes stop_codon:yes gene_type:complete
MVYKTGYMKGQMTTAEIRKLISAHNKLSNIKIPPGSTRMDILKLLITKGFNVNHETQTLVPLKRSRNTKITLSQAQEITKPKEKTALQKQKSQETKDKKDLVKKQEVREIKKKAIAQQKSILQTNKKPTKTPKKPTFNLKKNEVIPAKKAVPKGSHRMPDGSIMKNKDMKQDEVRAGDTSARPRVDPKKFQVIKKPVKPVPPPPKKQAPKPPAEAPQSKTYAFAVLSDAEKQGFDDKKLKINEVAQTRVERMNARWSKKEIKEIMKQEGFKGDIYGFVKSISWKDISKELNDNSKKEVFTKTTTGQQNDTNKETMKKIKIKIARYYNILADDMFRKEKEKMGGDGEISWITDDAQFKTLQKLKKKDVSEYNPKILKEFLKYTDELNKIVPQSKGKIKMSAEFLQRLTQNVTTSQESKK